MIKRILFCIMVGPLYALNHEQCRHEEHEDWFCDYMERHNRTYARHEVLARKKTLVQRPLDRDGVTFGMTSRSDRLHKGLGSNYHLKHIKHLDIVRPVTKKHIHLAAPRHLPPIDWRDRHGVSYVSPVKDQGDCGGCFAFASATVLEYWSRKEGHPKSLSPQSLMDCTSGTNQPDDGCEGGLMEYVFDYAMEHPVPLEVDWPYIERDGQCEKKLAWSHVQVQDYRVLMRETNSKAEHEIETLLHAYGPVSVGVDSTTMEDYTGGIFKADMCTTDIDHAVTVVGYTNNFWIIKNSWGPYWGEDGYLFLEKGKNACGIAEYVVYVTRARPVLKKITTT